ncbi:MAG TPA: hypothetical protein VK498_02300 [Ferruginibacter sp.]|nr:hypothetical protein [Ferruginibacter sp.]
MSELKKIQKEYSDLRREIVPVNLELQKAKAALGKLIADEKQELKGLDKQNSENRKNFYAEEKKRLADKADELGAGKKTLHDRFTDLSSGFLSQLDPVDKTAQLNDSFPILMFPLRLETRFRSTGNQQQLWLRVYPDDCNINTKEELLSESELNNARAFWIEIWKAGGIEAEEKGAWRSLVNSHGSGRSAWIIQEYKPVNIMSKPVKPGTDYKILVITSPLVLTAAESIAAKNYWADTWLAKGNVTLTTTAFNTLVAATNVTRANEIVTQYAPVNVSDEIPAGIDSSNILLERIELPAYTANQTSWTQATKTMALPDKFVAVTYNGSVKKNILFTKPVKDHLSVSLDPGLKKEEQAKKENGDLVLNEDLQWMVDFEKAVEVGMATKINLTTQEAASGFDKLFVVGIRFTSDETGGKEQLEKLLTDHFYSNNGFGLIKQGTPTNNTEDFPAGYSWTDNADESYERIFKQSEDFTTADEPDKKSDGEKLADCLGIDDSILKIASNGNGRDQLEANAMNTALFPATLGYFMEEMMDPLFSEKDIDATKAFFLNFVSGRGPIPAIRIGKQPYGILPVCAYSRLNFFDHSPVELSATINNPKIPYLVRLHSLLMKMDTAWDTLLPAVAYIGKNGDPHQVLLEVMGLHPSSVEYHQRLSQTKKQLYNQLNIQWGPSFATLITAIITQRGKQVLLDLGIDSKELTPPILEKYFLSGPNLLSGPLIDDVPDSEINPVRIYYTKGSIKLNYLEWLTSAGADNIRTENFEDMPAPTALLYLLLRHALMLSQADAGAKLLVAHNILENKKTFFDPDFMHVEINEMGKSKFEHLYNNYPVITGNSGINTKLVDHIYKPGVLQGSAETKRLKETVNALKVLEKTPTARLERLLAEHLDCCNYRIDAWKTGLVQYKLTEQRNIGLQNGKPSKGIYLGAYGWLLEVKPENKVLTNVNLSPALNEIFNKGNNTALQTDSNNLGYIHAPSLNQAATAAILRNAFDSNRNTGPGNTFAINLTSDRVRIADSFLEGIRNGQNLSALLGYQFERGLHDKYSLGQGEVDQFIYPLRKIFPLVADNLLNTKTSNADIDDAVDANNLPDDAKAIQNIEANNVIDGLKLITHIQNSSVKTYPFGLPANANLPVASSTQANAINEEVSRLIDIHDAISDLVISEQVYQVVQGNFERASGNAEAFSKGSYPPEIAIKDTPRSGITLTHRMVIHFDAEVAADPSMTARALAEPSVNKWLTDNLPAPENVLCKVIYSSPVQAETEVLVSQKDLGLQPIDLLYVFNLDTEQAMTELDDRITNHIIYSISLHRKTAIKINYTGIIHPTDKTKISFFELGALIKSLRKVLTGAKFLNPAQLTVPQEGQAQTPLLDDVQLKNRITALKDGLVPIKTAIEARITNTISIAAITTDLKTQLNPLIPQTSKVESIITQLQQDLKAYLINPVMDKKNAILIAFETNISSIGIAATINNLKLTYENNLNEYLNDFSNVDDLVKGTWEQCLNVAMYDNLQTGTGFMHQGISGVYDSVFSKLGKLIERWEKKQVDFETVMTGYDLAGIPEEQFLLLQKAERLISAQSTFPLPVNFNDYKINSIDIKKAAFDALLNTLKTFTTSATQKVTDFINEVETELVNIGDHDVVPFDTEKEKNDLSTEKLMLALLKEDIVNALIHLQKSVAEKITACSTLITDADATVVNTDKINILLNAVKKILGEEALLLPQFTLTGAQVNEFENSYGASAQILDFVKTKESRLFPVEDWLGGVARVREKVHSWENASFLYNAFNPGAALDVTPLQFPYQADDRWLGMKFRDDADLNEKDADGNFKFKISNDKLLYSAHFATGFNKNKPQCGIVIDEWTEVIPSDKETTGIAFHYDQPNSEPPQTILLVTPPQITGNWKWNDIIDAMEETLDMAKKRAIEPSQIESSAYAQFLPTTMMTAMMHPITMGVNLAANNSFKKSNNN